MATHLADPSAPGIVVMSKAPVPGLAKTRLIPDLGAHSAAKLQRWLLHKAVANAVEADVGPVRLWCAPDVLHPEFQRYGKSSIVTLHQQAEGDLGDRMYEAMQGSITHAGVLIMGTDCPVLDGATIRQAATALHDGSDAVMIPAEDGGYVLLGMKTLSRQALHAIDWSTDQVARQTRDRFSALGWSWSELSTLWDVDRIDDYQRLCSIGLVPHNGAELLLE